MHKNFGEWYRLVTLDPDGTKLAKRWAGVTAWVTILRKNDADILDTVRIFRGITSKTSKDAFLATFQKQDPAFPQRNDLELQVLAGASLVACAQSVGENGDGLRSAMVAGAAVEASNLLANEPRLNEISLEISSVVQAASIEHRKRKAFDQKNIRKNVAVAVEGLEKIAAASDHNLLKAAITPVFQALLDAVRDAERGLGDAAHNLRCADEETNILWWVEGGCSRDTNMPWILLKEATAIIAGAELADLTDVALGQSNAAALLERVVSESKGNGNEADLAVYVDALPDDWTHQRTAKLEEGKLDLLPLMRAVFHRAKSSPTKWHQYFDASSGIKSSRQITAARVARQAYVEAILLRTMAADTKA